MNNKDYWQRRGELTQKRLMSKADGFVDDMERVYKEAGESIERDISLFFQRFAKNEGMTLTEAKRLLRGNELDRFRMTVEEYIEKGREMGVSGKWIKELKSASDLRRISRLKALQTQINNQVEMLAAYKEQGLTKTLKEIFEEGYYRNIFNFQQFTGIGNSFEILDVKTINQALAKPWAYDGETFSSRIWKDKEKLKNSFEKTLTQGIIRGESPEVIARKIAKETNVELSAARRLVITESAAMSTRASMEGYEELGVEEIEFSAALDERTCPECGGMDGKHFPTKDGQIGLNMSPLHPRCRCTTIPYFDDEFTAGTERAARNEDGETYYVPSNMTYKQWKEKYVDRRDNADMGGIIGGVKNVLSGNSEKVLNSFKEGISNISDENVRNIFLRLAEETPVKTSFKRKSYHREGTIYLSSDATPSTLAHELFHKLDGEYGISESGMLSEVVRNDYERLKNIAEGYGGSIEEMLYSKYKEAFETLENGALKLKDEYRGISDILNGMSGGKIRFGYGHKPIYWQRNLALEKETFTQFGRTLYDGNKSAMDMLRYICPETHEIIISKLRELR